MRVDGQVGAAQDAETMKLGRTFDPQISDLKQGYCETAIEHNKKAPVQFVGFRKTL